MVQDSSNVTIQLKWLNLFWLIMMRVVIIFLFQAILLTETVMRILNKLLSLLLIQKNHAVMFLAVKLNEMRMATLTSLRSCRKVEKISIIWRRQTKRSRYSPGIKTIKLCCNIHCISKRRF